MKKLVFFSFLVFLYILSQSVFAGNDEDSIKVDIQKESLQLCNDLDSMLNLWHVKYSLKNNYADTLVTAIDDTLIPNFSDSIYLQRINEMNSAVPLSYNKIVRNFIELYAVKRREQVSVMLGLAETYFPKFEAVLDAYNLPLELKYVPVIESALNPRAVSRVGATGMWQFMYSTGKLYGLEITSFVDERRNPAKATIAAVNYLKDLYAIYNDWILVIAAYNCGPGNVNKAIRRSGGKRNFWDIYYRLPRETRGYVPAFIASYYVMAHHEDHKITPKRIAFFPTDTVMITEELHLKQVAEVLQLDLALVRDLNPEYKRDIIPAGKKNYSLELPAENMAAFIDLQDSIFKYNDSLYFNSTHTGFDSKSYSAKKYLPGPPSKNHKKLIYHVKSGDNVGYIADWYDIRTRDLRFWNDIHRNLIKAGQKLVIYKHKNEVDNYKNIDKMSFAEKQASIGKQVPVKTKKQESKPETGEYVYYTVKRGDNFWTIAKKFPGVSNTDIMNINNITDPRSLSPGQRLKIKIKEM